MNRYVGADHGGDVYSLWNIVDFSANVNPLGQPESVRDALISCAGACLHYPDVIYRDLRRAVASFEGVPPEWVVCGNGSVDLIFRFAAAIRPWRVVLLAPTFGEYERAFAQNGCAVAHYMLHEKDGFCVRDDILNIIPADGAVVLCNPNNPTGRLIHPQLLESILHTCGYKGTTLLVDECFMEFAVESEARSLKQKLAVAPHAMVLRSFTKIFAIPGVRLGHMITANAKTARLLEQTGPPWSVSVPAQLCGVAAAEEQAFARRTRETVWLLREGLREGLEELGIKVYPSDANYLLIKTDDPALGEKLLQRGFQLRTCSGFRGLSDVFYRVAVRPEHENAALLEAIKAIKETEQCPVS